MRRPFPSRPSLLHSLLTDPETGPAFRMRAQAAAMAPRQSFDVLTPADLESVKAKFRAFLAMTMQVSESRISKLEITAAPIPMDPTKSALEIDWDPPLTDEENECFREIMDSFNVFMGGRPLIWADDMGLGK